jgi:hypothetical protein
MGIKVIKDFQEDDQITLKLEYEDCRDISDRKFVISFVKNIKEAPLLNTEYTASTNNHPNDTLETGKINLVIDTSVLDPGIYYYSVVSMSAFSGEEVSTIARSGLNGVDTVECKRKFYTTTSGGEG